MISKKIKDLKEPLDIDLQTMACELDTSVMDMKFLSRNMMSDATLIDAFDALVEDIQKEGSEVTSFDDNTVLYEYLDEAVIIYDILGIQYILFDDVVASKIENKLNSYR